MLCQKCKKNKATVYYKENINGKVTEYSLCADCAHELERNGLIKLENPLGGMLRDSMSDFNSLFSGFFGGLDRVLGAQSASSDASGEKRCPLCGSTFREIAHSGRIGCPQCYETFADELSATVSHLHGTAKPSGRVPKRFGEKLNREKEIAALRDELQKSIETQEFEHAAELRDKIKALEAPAQTADAANNDSETSDGKESM